MATRRSPIVEGPGPSTRPLGRAPAGAQGPDAEGDAEGVGVGVVEAGEAHPGLGGGGASADREAKGRVGFHSGRGRDRGAAGAFNWRREGERWPNILTQKGWWPVILSKPLCPRTLNVRGLFWTCRGRAGAGWQRSPDGIPRVGICTGWPDRRAGWDGKEGDLRCPRTGATLFPEGW